MIYTTGNCQIYLLVINHFSSHFNDVEIDIQFHLKCMIENCENETFLLRNLFSNSKMFDTVIKCFYT